jgi:hypothetical protein
MANLSLTAQQASQVIDHHRPDLGFGDAVTARGRNNVAENMDKDQLTAMGRGPSSGIFLPPG